MFKKNKNKRKRGGTANKKLVKKILGKDSKRPIFGFPCSPDIRARFKMLAGQVDVPIYGLGEHALQLVAEVITRMAEDSEQIALLRSHIIESHVAARTIEKITAYDQDMAERLHGELIRRFEIDRAAHEIVVKFLRSGLTPKDISWSIDYGMRCRLAIAQGKPIPKDWPQDA